MNKGFTLIELLAVIVILSIIVIVTTVSVNSTIDDATNSLTNVQEKKIEEAAEAYYIKEGINTNDPCVSAQELINKGYIEASALELVATSESNLGYVKITTSSNNITTYTYQVASCE